jgi:hypothetical protein
MACPADESDMRIRREERLPAGTRTGLDLRLIVSCPVCQAWLGIEEGAEAVSCADCRERYLLAPRTYPFAAVIAPQIDAIEARRQARTFLRSGAHRATQVGAGRWLLLPYWRYRAKSFQWIAGLRHAPPGTSGEEFRDLRVQSFDLLIPAAAGSLRPDDLPPRPGVVTAYPFSPQVTSGAHLEPVTVDPDLARGFALAEVEGRSVPRGTPVVRRRLSLVGEELFLIYLPFFSLDYSFRDEKREVIVDGVLGEVVAHRDVAPAADAAADAAAGDGPRPTAGGEPSPASRIAPPAATSPPAAAEPSVPSPPAPDSATADLGLLLAPDHLLALRRPSSPVEQPAAAHALFLPRLCPGCADDLRLEPHVSVHACVSCGRAWEVTGGTLREVRLQVAVTRASGPGAHYLPFWRLAVITRGVGPLPGIPPAPASPDGCDQFLTVFVPAFESWQAERLNHIGVHLTRAHPELVLERPGPEILDRERTAESRLTVPGVTLSRKDAERLAWVIVGSLASAEPNTFARLLDQGRVETASAALVWLPFRQSGLYLREPASGALMRALPGTAPSAQEESPAADLGDGSRAAA